MNVNSKFPLWGLIALALMLLCPTSGRAQGLSFAFSNSAQSAPPGGILQYSGAVTNTSGTTLFLTFSSLSLTPSSIATADDSVFFDSVTQPYLNGSPVSLVDGETLSLSVFTVTLDVNTTPGLVASGVFSLQADTSSDPGNPGTSVSTSDVPFTVTVVDAPAAVDAPEPASGAMLTLPLLGFAGTCLSRRVRRRAFPH